MFCVGLVDTVANLPGTVANSTAEFIHRAIGCVESVSNQRRRDLIQHPLASMSLVSVLVRFQIRRFVGREIIQSLKQLLLQCLVAGLRHFITLFFVGHFEFIDPLAGPNNRRCVVGCCPKIYVNSIFEM
jgi:hypothetical protein